jgi:hypothetical protein
MSLGSYVLYLRALRGGITPREVASEIDLPEHYIHAIELEKHVGDTDSRTKLADYFNLRIDDIAELARSSHARFLDSLKKERRPQVGFLLMDGETLLGTVDGADSSIIKIVELQSGVKTILQRHAIKKWWLLNKPMDRRFGDRPGGRSDARPGGGGGDFRGRRPPMGGGRPPMGGGGSRPPMGGGGTRPPGGGGGGFGDRRPPPRQGGYPPRDGGNFRDNNRDGGGNFRDNNRDRGNYQGGGGGNYRDNPRDNGNNRDNNRDGGGNYRDNNRDSGNYRPNPNPREGSNYRDNNNRDNGNNRDGGGNVRDRNNNNS